MVQRTTSAARVLASPTRVALLHALQHTGGPLGVDELATAAGVHVNTAREHLDRLRAAGFVDRSVEHRGTRGRPRVLWTVVDRPAAATRDARFREQLLRVVLDGYAAGSSDAAERAGQAWARQHAAPGLAGPAGTDAAADGAAPAERRQLALLETHLEDLGLAPDLDTGGRRVHLRDCPFLPLARERTQMVCSVHLGIIRGVLACEDGPVRAERLEPFVGPEHCVLHLTRDDAASPSAAAPYPRAAVAGPVACDSVVTRITGDLRLLGGRDL